MANPDAPFGFRPVGRNGGPYNGPLHRVFIPSAATTTDIFVGDIVQLLGSASTDGYPAVDVVSAVGDVPYGVVTAFEANPSNLEQQYAPKATARYAKVVLCDEAVFEVQADDTMALADVGGNLDYVLGAGSTVTGMSGFELDASAVTTTAGDVLQIQSFVDRADNDPTLTNANVIVKFNDAATHPDRLGLAT
jgi:hypothetical protein